MNSESASSSPEDAPKEVDQSLAFAAAEESAESTSPSILGRIGEITGSKPQVLLRDESAGDAPMLKPLGPDDRVSAGKYVVQGELGRGGVGTVHKGHDQDLGRDVAMKFLHEKYKDHPDVLHRFVEEAQIGGQLQHPGIVPVYDLGMADGKPFFAMKLVKGQTLAKKLAERESTASDRREFLSIFEDVCQTLAYAHARGVVHRDLKPANIMIGSFGEVQVVDWGMGKVLGNGADEGAQADEKLAADRAAERRVVETVRSDGHSSQSIAGSVMGTPAYMPPEQARGDIEAMDERSDVFALGAILCEILTGAPPYVGTVGEQISMAALAELDDARARLAACGGEPEMVALATRCLMPAPAARPRSAEVVAKAVHDHLAAVEARVHAARVEAAEAKVRAASLKRTQTLGIGLTVAITAGLVASLWFWRSADKATENEEVAKLAAVASAEEAQENERRARDQTALAERELARAVEIKHLITEMLQSVTPVQAASADITLLKGILDTASQRLTDDAIEDDLVAAELRDLTGSVYFALGLHSEAELHLPAAVETRQRLLGEEHPDTLSSTHGLALLYRAQARYVEAEPLFQETLEIRTRVLGAEHPDTLWSMGHLAKLYAMQGRYAEAESLLLVTVESMERVLGEEHPNTQTFLGSLASLYSDQGRYAEAEPLYLGNVEVAKRTLGAEHPNTLASMTALVAFYGVRGLYAEAEPLALETLTIKRRVLGEEHPSTLDIMSNLALIYLNRRRFSAAEALYLQVLEIEERVFGVEHPSALVSVANLASLYVELGRYAEAESLYLRVLEVEQRVLGDEHPRTLTNLGNLAYVYDRQGRAAEAEPLYVQTLEASKRVLGEDHPTTLHNLVNLTSLFSAQGRHAEAEPLYLRTLTAQKRVLGDEHPKTLGTITNLGTLYNSMERFEDAAAMFEQSLPIKRRVLGLEHPWTGYAMTGLAAAYVGLGRTEDALPLQREYLDLQVAPAAASDASAEVLSGAAWRLLTTDPESLRDPERALGLAERACELAEESGHARTWAMLDTLALAQYRNGDTAAAIETQRRALARMPEGASPQLSERLAWYEAALEDD